MYLLKEASALQRYTLLPLLPPGLRAFACYVQAHAVYLTGDHARSLGIAQTALVMQGQTYPIPTIYLHLVAVMDLMSLRRSDEDASRLTLPVGIAFAALGAFCLIAPGVVLSIIPLIFGIVLLIDGAEKLGRALELRRTGFARWGVVACVAVIIMVFGVMLVTQPFVAVESVMIMFGALLAADGLMDVYFLFRIYRLSRNR